MALRDETAHINCSRILEASNKREKPKIALFSVYDARVRQRFFFFFVFLENLQPRSAFLYSLVLLTEQSVYKRPDCQHVEVTIDVWTRSYRH